jgi:hypothetical protein
MANLGDSIKPKLYLPLTPRWFYFYKISSYGLIAALYKSQLIPNYTYYGVNLFKEV